MAVVTDGTGIDATWQIARPDGVAICIAYDGGTGLVDAAERPNVSGSLRRTAASPSVSPST